jgi:hypothetical protein
MAPEYVGLLPSNPGHIVRGAPIRGAGNLKESLMKMLMFVKFPPGKFNAAVRDGSIEKKMKKILEDTKPESAHFAELDGHRGGVMVVNVADASKIPFYAEPWFLTFDAEVQFRIAMTPEDLGRAGLEALGKKWA